MTTTAAISSANTVTCRTKPILGPNRIGFAEFRLPARYAGKTVWLHLDGINYRADVWLNGRQVADAKSVVGMFRRFCFDVSSFVSGGGTNAIAVRIHPLDFPGDRLYEQLDGFPGEYRAGRRRRRDSSQCDRVLQRRLGFVGRRGPRPQHRPLAARVAGSDGPRGGARSGGHDRPAASRRPSRGDRSLPA